MKKIYRFDPVVYPRKLWVCLDNEIVGHLFKTPNGNVVHIEQEITATGCVVPRVIHRQTEKYGVLVVIHHPQTIGIEAISHEAVHVASSIFDELGMLMSFAEGRDEHYAYLVGWAAECIEKAIKQHNKS